MKKSVLCILFCLAVRIGYGQYQNNGPQPIEDKLTFYLLDVESGLSHNVVNSIEQDSLGFMWIATIDGLNRYDGGQFTRYKTNYRLGQNSLVNNYVQQVKLNNKGELLLATDKGLNIYDPKREVFTGISQEDGLLSNSVSSLAFGPSNELILGLYRGGVQILKDGVPSAAFKHQEGNQFSISSNEISSLSMQGDSVLWVGTFDQGLNKIDYPTKTITRIYNPAGQSAPLSINSLYTDGEGNIWVGSKVGIHVITVEGDTLSLGHSFSSHRGLSDSDVLSFEEDNKGQLWIGTRNGGLNIINKQDFLSKASGFSVKYFWPTTDGSSVFNRTISSIKMDREGNMWLGTSTGLNFVNTNGEPIKLLQNTIASRESISHNRIGSLAESSDGKIWIGTDGGGLDLLDPKTGKFKHYVHDPQDPNSLSNNYILSLHEDKKRRLWVGTYQGGLNKMDPLTGYSKHYLQGGANEGSDVRVIFENSKGEIWVGTNRGGLFKYSEDADEFTFIERFGRIDIRDIDEDEDGNLWMATFGSGIIKYMPDTDSADFFTMENTDGLPSDIAFSVVSLSARDVLIGTRYGGMVRLNPISGEIRNFTEYEGLSNNTVSSIIRDNDNGIWLGTFNGISYYNPTTHEIVNFNNMQHSEFNIGAALKSSNGILYFGGNKGLNLFNPTDVRFSQTSFPLVFDNLKVFNKPISVDPKDKNGILSEHLAYQNHITLAHHQTLFSVDFSVLKYPNANDVTYSYLLEGYHQHWIDTQSTGTANLSNIPPGKYLLKVKAHIGQGKVLTNELPITITPPFWKTIPAYLLYLVLMVGIVWGIMRYYAERIRLRNMLLFEKKERQLEHDLNEERLRFFTSFSHELKTPLTLILAPVEDLIAQIKTKKHRENLLLIHKNGRYLYSLIDKLLEFRKSEVGLNQLKLSEYNLSVHLEQWVLNYQPLAKKKQILLTLSLPENEVVAYVDLEKIQIIVNNVLSNAIKHCKVEDRVQVYLSQNETCFTVKVSDSGPGINPKDHDHIFEWYYQSGRGNKRKKGTGIGLALSKSLAELHKGKIAVEQSSPSGSIFIISIPLDQRLSHAVSPTPEPPVPSEQTDDAWKHDILIPPPEKISKKIQVRQNRELILLIDDNPDILVYLDGILGEQYNLIHAENGQEGLEKASQYVPDLIISDIMMPEKNGIDLCAILKEQMTTTHIPIILLSAKDNSESIQTGYQKGADDYITKPFSGQIMLARIRNLLDNRIKLRKYFSGLEEQVQGLSDEDNKLLDREKEFLRKLDIVILKNLLQDNTQVDVIAQDMNLSRTSLFRKIKAITGQNINEYIRSVRLKRAAHLIKEERYTVSQAAFEVGFSSVKYFRKMFKEQFKQLPSELMKE